MPIIETRGIHKIYGNGVHANDDINFEVEQGEIHALVGENGAGKSTLMKILYGLEHATSGQVFIREREVAIGNPQDAIEQGIGMVHQNFMLVDSFTVAQNIILNRETKQGVQIDFQQGRPRYRGALQRLWPGGQSPGQNRRHPGRHAPAGRDPQGALSRRRDPHP